MENLEKEIQNGATAELAPIAALTIGGELVNIRMANMQQDPAFRRCVDRMAAVIVAAFSSSQKRVIDQKGGRATLADLEETELIPHLLPPIMEDGIPAALDALFAYAPELDRERIEREADPDELEEAALAVVVSVAPFLRERMNKAVRMVRIIDQLA